MAEVVEEIAKALRDDNAPLVRELLERHPALRARINEPLGDFDSPIISCARSPLMLDVLLDAGADINAKSRWWAGGFGLLHTAPPQLATYAITRGAIVDVHAAARLGMLEKLRDLVSANPQLVKTRGGDGQMPLHFASTVEVAEYLLQHGAEIDARDIDHESTAAQYMVRDRQVVLRCLVRHGCATDLLMAAALGDLDLVRKHLDENPDTIRVRVSDDYFPMTGGKTGGTIYQWTLGWYVSPHDVAREFKHDEVFRLLMERSPADVKLMVACWAGDTAAARQILAQHPRLTSNLGETDRRLIAHAARNNNLAAVRSLLAAGFDVNVRSQHGATPLHWAAWHGNTEMVRDILQHNPPLEDLDHHFAGTPLQWAMHGSENGWYRQSGDYPKTVQLIIGAGAQIPAKLGGSAAVQSLLATRPTS